MKVRILYMGKTAESDLGSQIKKYTSRISRYCELTEEVIPDLKKQPGTIELIAKKEGQLIMTKINAGDYIVLLHVKGKQLSSESFAAQLNKWMVSGKSKITFVIGGAYGFSSEIINRGDYLLSLSTMTFSHQLIRLIFAEQLYRAFTILRNEPYHH